MTGRDWSRPPGFRTFRQPTIGASTKTSPIDDRCIGWIENRATWSPSTSTISRSKACSAADRAPVSTFAFIAATPRSGSETHSLHPIVSATGTIRETRCQPGRDRHGRHKSHRPDEGPDDLGSHYFAVRHDPQRLAGQSE